MTIDHDQLFKLLITEFFREFVELFLPNEAPIINFSRITFLDKEYFTDIAGGRRKQLYLVVQVGRKDGGEEFILVHVEFQSQKVVDFPRRMYQYYCQLFLRHGKPIIPVAIFADDAVWRRPVNDEYQVQFSNQVYVWFRYHLIKLKVYDYRQFLDSENPLTYALMAKMGYDRQQRTKLKGDFLRLILGAKINPARKNILIDFVEAYMRLNAQEQKEFDAIITAEPKFKEVKEMVTVYEQRGIEKGLIQEGREMIVEALDERFGTVPRNLSVRINRIGDRQQLKALLRQAVRCSSLHAFNGVLRKLNHE